MERVGLEREAHFKQNVFLKGMKTENPSGRILYENFGFTKRGIQNWYADNTGWIDFYLYEFILE